MAKREPISAIKLAFDAVTSDQDPLFDRYEADDRAGVQAIIERTHKRLIKLAAAQTAFDHRFKFEREARLAGRSIVAGMDEVGRGPLAGPVVACAVVLPDDFDVIEVNDSKQLTDRIRERLYPQIIDQALAVSIGLATPAQIDTLNIYQATRVAMLDAVTRLSIQPQQLLIDAMTIDSPIPQLKLIKGDAKSNSIAAASIVAKVFRDHLMASYDTLYPGYDFTHNAGYGTKAHLLGLSELGPSPIHRKTFEPVSDYFA